MYNSQICLCKATGTTTWMMFTIAIQYFGMRGVLQTWIGRISKICPPLARRSELLYWPETSREVTSQ